MNKNDYNSPVALGNIQITDEFWKGEMELVREEIIPYQWRALNDQIEEAEPSFCMRNFKVAGKQNEERREKGDAFEEPAYTFRGFQALPEDMNHLEDKFYGFVFQDSDFYKWIEAVAYSLTSHPDPELEKIADEAIDIVCAAQQEDGYLDTYYIINGKDKIFSNLRDHHELYCFGHLAEGAVAYYEATGKDKLLNATKRFADYIDNYFGPEEEKCKGYPGHEIAEMALVRLYEVTGEKKYLDLSRFFVEERGKRPYYYDGEDHPEKIAKGHENDLRYFYHQAHVPVREQDEVTGHAVRGVYLYSGMADLARLYNDDSMFEACDRLWDNMVQEKMYITGGIGATHLGEAFSYAYDLPNDTAYAETCASIGLVFWGRRMLQMKPDSKYADAMEVALYNGILSGMALDGKSFFYVNPLESVPKACHFDERKFHVKPIRQKWFGCACCPPNLARLLSSIGAYTYTEKDDTLFVHLYMGSTVKKEVNGTTAEISIQSGYPWNGNVAVKVAGTKEKFTMAFRIPGWCGDYKVEGLGGADVIEKDGYLYVTKAWSEDDVLTFDFPMEVKVVEADWKVREDIGKVAVLRGPIVYCIEEVDNGKDLHMVTLDVTSEPVVADREVAGAKVKGITMKGFRAVPTEAENKGLYHLAGARKKEEMDVQMVPYYTWANRGENEMQVWTRMN